MKKVKIDKKRLISFVLIVALLIIIAIVIVVCASNDDDKIIEAKNETIDVQVEESEEDEYDGNIYCVPQEYTENSSVAVDENGEELDEETIATLKSEIMEAFKELSPTDLGIDVDYMSELTILFNSGTTKIAGTTCLVFSAYQKTTEGLTSVGQFAMSIDKQIVYKFDFETQEFNLVIE